MTILDVNNPFIREAWAEVDAIDEMVGLDPAMFPFPEPQPEIGSETVHRGFFRTRITSNAKPPAPSILSGLPKQINVGGKPVHSYLSNCRCESCRSQIAVRFQTRREARDHRQAHCHECERAYGYEVNRFEHWRKESA